MRKIIILLLLAILFYSGQAHASFIDFLLYSVIETDAQQSKQIIGRTRDPHYGLYERNPISANMCTEYYRDYIEIKKYFFTNADKFLSEEWAELVKGLWFMSNLWAVMSNDRIFKEGQIRSDEIYRAIALEYRWTF